MQQIKTNINWSTTVALKIPAKKFWD